MRYTFNMPSRKETLTVVGITALFLLLTAVCLGLRPEHLLMAFIFLALFFAGSSPVTFLYFWYFVWLDACISQLRSKSY